jgi:hypothetical protein
VAEVTFFFPKGSINMTNELGFKELYEVSIKTTLAIEVGEKIVEAGETIAFFDKI